MQWTGRPSRAERNKAKLAERRAAARMYYRWFAWHPVKLMWGNRWVWLEMVERTDNWISHNFCVSQYYPAGWFEEQRRRQLTDW